MEKFKRSHLVNFIGLFWIFVGAVLIFGTGFSVQLLWINKTSIKQSQNFSYINICIIMFQFLLGILTSINAIQFLRFSKKAYIFLKLLSVVYIVCIPVLIIGNLLNMPLSILREDIVRFCILNFLNVSLLVAPFFLMFLLLKSKKIAKIYRKGD